MLLDVLDLSVQFVARDEFDVERTAHALNAVSFSLDRGRILGLVGESGAGKSLTVTAILGLLRAPARLVGGQAVFEGEDLLAMPPSALAKLRGGRIGLVVQSPRTALDPLARVGEQLVRVQRAHSAISHREALTRAEAMLAAVGIPAPASRMAAWPHELSGGMAQRVVIALALINEPHRLIAAEPTTGLDGTVQAQILRLLMRLRRELGMALMLITHDFGVIAGMVDRVHVMLDGRIVETGLVDALFANPQQAYTQALLAAVPRLDVAGRLA